MLNSYFNRLTRNLSDIRNVVLYLFVLIVLAISWSGIKTIQTNYDLQKKISALKQQNTVLQLQNDNTALQNKYYQTDQYLDLAARQDLGLAGPGEQVLLVPHAVAMRYINQTVAAQIKPIDSNDDRPSYIKNLNSWRNFLLGREAQQY